MSNETKLKTVSASLSPSESATDNSNWDKFKDKTSNLTLPISSTPKQLNLLLAKLLNNTESDFAFYINGFELATDLEKFLEREKISAEEQINIVFDQKEPLWVRPVTRCSSSLSGHENSILVVRFSPDSKSLATGAGDNTVRLWDLNTEMPRFKLEAHGGWVQALAWSPDSSLLSSGCYSGILCLWNPSNGELIQKFSAHSFYYFGKFHL
ncbi:hypothetical protein MHBO_002134 [Bonamia ostreae]|uniref:NLE domain-containing protein n=1 Tax=Bonamia ostreae TaxID=126728 RepID=A0ABV2ALV0_9EUKA